MRLPVVRAVCRRAIVSQREPAELFFLYRATASPSLPFTFEFQLSGVYTTIHVRRTPVWRTCIVV